MADKSVLLKMQSHIYTKSLGQVRLGSSLGRYQSESIEPTMLDILFDEFKTKFNTKWVRFMKKAIHMTQHEFMYILKIRTILTLIGGLPEFVIETMKDPGNQLRNNIEQLIRIDLFTLTVPYCH